LTYPGVTVDWTVIRQQNLSKQIGAGLFQTTLNQQCQWPEWNSKHWCHMGKTTYWF